LQHKGGTRWFWEPNHFKRTLGEKILATVYHGASDFGVLLTPDTIEARLTADAAAKTAYQDRDDNSHNRLARLDH
jgi:hypothetical protein